MYGDSVACSEFPQTAGAAAPQQRGSGSTITLESGEQTPNMPIQASRLPPRIMQFTLAAILLAPTPLSAQERSASPPSAAPTSLIHAFELAQQAQAAGDHAALRSSLTAGLAFAPDHGLLLYHLARAEALAGDAERALSTLERLAVQGAARDVAADTAFSVLRGMPRFQVLVRQLAESAAPLVRSDTAFAIPDPDFIPEGIAYDPTDDAFYVGSLHQGGVIRVARNGATTPFARAGQDGIGQVIGLRVDVQRRRLWLATLIVDSAAPRFFRGVGGWAALHAYDLETGRLVMRYPAPDSTSPHLLNDIALTPGGDVYVTDSEGNALYRLRSGASRLERVHGGAADFTYPNGITLAPDGTRLFVAHMEGMSALDIAGSGAGRMVRMTAPPGVALSGIDGLYTCGNDLLAVQRLLDFQQITRFTPAPGEPRITGAVALERRHPSHDAATTGAIAGDSLFYISNGLCCTDRMELAASLGEAVCRRRAAEPKEKSDAPALPSEELERVQSCAA
jgi:sugar lactone lactonase YvrE/xanthosine utilization system XapX-like protein